MIRNRTENALRTLSLDWLYNRVTGKPARKVNGPFGFIETLIAYQTDPGEAAYYDIRDALTRWRKANGKYNEGGDPTERQDALYYYKRALAWDDERAAKHWLNRYKELGGTMQGMAQSIRMADPLGPLGAAYTATGIKNRAAFKKTLTAEQKETLRDAEQWYKEVYQGRRSKLTATK